MSTIFTLLADLIMGFPGLTVTSASQAAVQIILNCLFLYIAVMPVVAVTARISNGHMIGTIVAFVYGYGGMFAAGNATLAAVYPITASLGLIGYRSYDPAVHWDVRICLFSMAAALTVSAVFVSTAKGTAPVRAARERRKTVRKKGW